MNISEIRDAINLLKVNTAPGSDGITTDFYKLFAELLAPFLLEVFTESVTKSTLPTSMTQGVICLIPKPKKDLLLLDNWRPINLLNNDYKLFALIFAIRVDSVLDTVVDEKQSGFMSGNIFPIISDWFLISLTTQI